MNRDDQTDRCYRSSMKNNPSPFRETTEQWDDLPAGAKVVGKRRPSLAYKAGYDIQALANELSGKRIGWPKGVFRFKTHEEADAWWRETMKIINP